MKLIEILASNWSNWPAGQAVEQTSLGDVFCSTYGIKRRYGYYEIAEDQDTAVVTQAQWTVERSKPKFVQ